MIEDSRLVTIVRRMTRDAESYRDTLSKDRSENTDYYNGEVTDLPSTKGRSSMVSKDVRANIKKLMPSVKRTILGGDKIWEFEPTEQQDEATADQATDVINMVVAREAEADKAIEDACHDAMLVRTGIIKAWYEKKQEVEISSHSGLSEDALAQLVSPENVDVLEQDETLETVETEQGPVQIPAYSVKIKRIKSKGRVALAAVPPEQFLIDRDAQNTEDAMLVGQVQTLRRGDLVAMGYDRKLIEEMPSEGKTDNEQLESAREDRVDNAEVDDEQPGIKSLEEIDYYELFVKIDRDEDGLNELLRICFAGGLGENNLLEIEDWDRQPFVDILAERQPHQREGASIADDTKDIQKVKTALLRAVLDNIYWQNRPQPIIADGKIENEDAVFEPEFGKPIRVSGVQKPSDALDYTKVPFVAKNAFDMLEYFDNVAQDRTGISEASSGMAPDALQNMTAKASAMIESAGIGQTESMLRTMAQGLARVGSLLLHLTIQHQDKPRTVRLRNEWVEYDPRTWNAEMDVTVNTGLGAGSRERDMQMLLMILNVFERVVAQVGPDNPFIKPDNLYAVLSEIIEAAGFRSTERFVTKPDPQEVEMMLQMKRQQGDPETMKAQASIQLEQAKMQANRDKEMAQLEADLRVKAAEQQNDLASQRAQIEADAVRSKMDAEIQRERLAQERELKMMEMAQQREIEQAKLTAQQQQREAQEVAGALRDRQREAA